jgi:hypothetical protein
MPERTLFDGVQEIPLGPLIYLGPGLSQQDMLDFSEGKRRVYALMVDGAWHTASQIREAAGKNGLPASEGLRRMRELRRWYKVEKMRVGESREYLYRLVQKGA